MTAIVLPKLNTQNLEWIYPLFSLIKNAVVLTDATSNILYVNDVYQRVTGYTAAELIGKNPGMMRSGYHDQEFYSNLWNSLKTQGGWEGVIWNRNKTGKVFPAGLTITQVIASPDQTVYYLGIFEDLMLSRPKDAAVANLLLYDFLTKLPNRLAAEDYFNHIVKSILLSEAYSADPKLSNKLALAYLDLNEFKNVNDQYGYLAGDELLALAAGKMQMLMRDTDYLARLENDHFILIMSGVVEESEIQDFLYTVYDIFSQPFIIDGVNIYTSCSIGVALLQDKTESLEQLIERAKLSKK